MSLTNKSKIGLANDDWSLFALFGIMRLRIRFNVCEIIHLKKPVEMKSIEDFCISVSLDGSSRQNEILSVNSHCLCVLLE